MANRMKEDEKNEKIIRGLLKLPANRRCINCNNLGPQYVCTNFWTFICTNCSGMHREFTHRVKSISMAKFTSQEVITLQDGGNERAKSIYFKEWDPQRHSFPDSSNIDRLREFIKHVYVDRRYTGERGTNKPPRVKSDREDYNENRTADSYRGASRSPPFEDRYDHPFNERSSSGGRNDERFSRYGYEDRSPAHDGDSKRSPGQFDVVDERRRDDKTGNGNQIQRIEDRRFPDAVHRASARSPSYQKGVDSSSPPLVRPVRDILGDDVPPLQVGDLPKPNGTGVPENSSKTQRTTSSSSLGSSDGNPVELKRANSGSLIDFNINSDPPVSSTQHVPQQTVSPLASSENWASFDVVPQQKASQTSANASSIQSSLDQLLVPAIAPTGNMPSPPVSGVHALSGNNDTRQIPVMPQNQADFFAAGNTRSALPPSDISMTWGPSVAQNMQVNLTAPAGQPSQGTTVWAGGMGSALLSQTPADAKPIGRNELPQDLFTALYPPAATSFPAWPRTPHPSMGYSMQYPVGNAIQTFPQASQSTNPFELVNETSLPHASSFPSMASLQGALPNMTGNAPLLRSASLGTPLPQWMHLQQTPSYQMASSPSPYLVQQGLTNTAAQAPNHSFPMVNHGGGFGGAGAAFGASGMETQSGARYAQQGTPSASGGNPFG
ncbi:probable ADP-ribosylation factor GTPase-activating protein AGD14 isoform X2 [Dioscorea cayenensis subsp. rotundata]|uniref:Probable ADP-ribosylation factor GTPase-activating protein AGD14 isoform X2 n=1 Tax=Dioscorea cayennensis subsp. rotundata TaxID=55577 RepID=A0AB40CSN1_DIOCR|nr:probable ADP-ribosylation factor GTPase-activating protein AGD14 isoform X2 [Dioscorea cayenensis subsp. rotundata]